MANSLTATITLTELCFPDITGKVLRGWGQVVISAGQYVTGGLPMGLIAWLDARTVDFNGFLRCDVWDEQPITTLMRYHYNPVTDTLQIFNAAGVEVTNGTALPNTSVNATETDNVDAEPGDTDTAENVLLFEVSVDRTTVRG